MHTQKAVDVFGKELDRLARFTNRHHFHLRCYKSGIVPPSLKIRAPVNSERARAAAARASRIFTQERVKSSWRARQSALRSVEGCQENLRATLSIEDFGKVDGIFKCSAESTFKKFKERQVVKFDNLRKQIIGINEKPGDVNLRSSWVVNLCNHKLSTTEGAVLAKGPKYAVTPKINPVDIAAPIEAAPQLSSATDQDWRG